MNIPYSLFCNLQLRGDFLWIFSVSLRISDWTLQWRGEWTSMRQGWMKGPQHSHWIEGSGFLGLNISNTISPGSRPKKSQVAWQCITTGHTRHGRRVVMLMGHWNLCRADFFKSQCSTKNTSYNNLANNYNNSPIFPWNSRGFPLLTQLPFLGKKTSSDVASYTLRSVEDLWSRTLGPPTSSSRVAEK